MTDDLSAREVDLLDGGETSMTDLKSRVALVTGGSRGVGKGIALGLAEAGATVYVTGRTVDDAQRGNGCVPLRCDHTDDRQVESVFNRITHEQGRLDVLVN